MKNKRINMKEKGITLVALVVTIIVLLILAGITISLALSNDGLIGRAQHVSNIWANATRDEETTMEQFANDVNTLTEGFISREGNNTNVLKLLTEEEISNAKGQFVKWNVPYTDVFNNSFNYTQNDGWRILKIQEGSTIGKYNIQIISTGIPSLLDFQAIYDIETLNSSSAFSWWGTDHITVKNYYSDVSESNFLSGDSWKYNYSAFYAAYGLNEKFTDIPFIKGLPEGLNDTTTNKAYFSNIKNLDTITNVKDAFSDNSLKNKVIKIREIVPNDIRSSLGKVLSTYPSAINDEEDSSGLFKLANLKSILSDKNYNDAKYWVGAPYEYEGLEGANMFFIENWGNAYSNNGSSNTKIGLRPVITIDDVQMSYDLENNIWQVK